MATLLGVGLIICLFAIAAARRLPGSQYVRLIARTGLVALGAWVIWATLVMGGVVPAPALRHDGFDRPVIVLFMLGPPATAALTYAVMSARRSTRGHHERPRDSRQP